jgi:flagella basal body P-ring formation protein FlgA
MIYSFLILLTFLFSSNDKLNKSVNEYLKNKLSEYDKYEFKIVNAPDIKGNFEIKNDSKINLGSSFAYIPVNIEKSNSNTVQTYITVKLKLFKTICVAKNEIDPKEPLSQGNVEFKMMNISNLRGTPLSSSGELHGFRSRVKVQPGSVLLKEFLEEIPIVNVGDMVTAAAISGNVKISTKAEARQEGVGGDIISIVTKDKKQFKAKIIDSNNVMVIE